MMSVTQQRTGGQGRAAPTRRRLARAMVLALTAGLAIVQQGCQTAGCNSCGSGIGSRLTAAGANIRDFGRRVFNHKRSEPCCEPALGGAAVEYGGEVLTPAPAPGAIIQAPATTGPSQLDPIDPVVPSATPLPSEGASTPNPTSGATKSAYMSRRPRTVGSRPRPANLARALLPEGGASSRPTAKGSSYRSEDLPPPEEAPSLTNPLDNPPPLELAPEVLGAQRSAPTTGSPPAAPAAAGATTAVAPTGSPPDTPPAPAAAPTPAPIPTTQAPAATSVAPGSWRFATLEPGLAGGSTPGPADLDWLQDKGYATLVDLRPAAEVQSAFITEVSRRGFRYVLLPVTLETLDAGLINRFHSELALTGARPLFFFDGRGADAGILWYIRRRALDKVDEPVARREALELGEVDLPRWEVARVYLDGLKPPTQAPAAAPAPTPAPTPAPAPAPSSTEPPPPPPAPVAEAGPKAEEAEKPTSLAWKPLVVTAATILAVPLAYLGRTGLNGLGRAARASLTATVKSPRALPPASGAGT